MFYEVPSSLAAEIDELESLVERFRRQEMDAASFKARRVPFGCYEQRRDGFYMLRIRATAGAITPRQLGRIASLSDRYGSEAVHITTRQEFQIHDVALENVIPILRELLTVGLSTRGGGGNTVRNIIVSPESGLYAAEAFDPSPYAFALTTRLIAESDSWTLPRKLKIAFSHSAEDTAFAQFNDIGFIAAVRDGVKGFKVYVAGGFGRKPAVGHLLHEFIPADRAYAVAESVKRLFDRHGNRKNRNAARLRFLWEELGETRFREIYQAEFDALSVAGSSALHPAVIEASAPIPAVSPLREESAEYLLWRRRYCKEQRQKGLYSVLVPLTHGNVRNSDLRALATLLEEFGENSIRATFGQNLRLRNIPESYLGNVHAAIKKISTLAGLPAVLSNSIACTGADTCKLGICLPKGALTAIQRKLARSGLGLDQIPEFRLNLSGCPNSCGQHPMADLGFFGQARRKDQRMYPAYGIVGGAVRADGNARLAVPLGQISARELPNFVADALGAWIGKKKRFASFSAYVDGEGAGDLRAIAEKYRAIPDFEDDKNYYFDWGAENVFSLVGRGVGECSAGLFDLIDVDLKLIEVQRQRLNGDLSESDRADALYRIVLSASRMLLVTRGIEAPSDAAVIAGFIEQFIRAGLVDSAHMDVVSIAATQKAEKLLEHEPAVLALAEAVRNLYAGMDNSLRFPGEAGATAVVPRQSSPVEERDYRGVACPMNFVKVKFNLSRMAVGEHLRVLLDDGQPIENVPRSVAQEGHKVLSQTKVGDHWSVEIEKR